MDQFSHDFFFSRGKEIRWRFKYWDVMDVPYGNLPENIESRTTKLRAEVTRWFHQNVSVESIEFKIWGGYPWGFYFNEADIPDQDDIYRDDSEIESDNDIEIDDDVSDL